MAGTGRVGPLEQNRLAEPGRLTTQDPDQFWNDRVSPLDPELDRRATQAVRELDEELAYLEAEEAAAKLDESATEHRIEAVDLDAFLRLRFAPRRWLVPGLLQERDLGMIHGWRGVGKTRFVHALIYALAAGDRFLRYVAGEPRGVLLLDGETPREELQERLCAVVHGAEKEAAAPFRIVAADMQENPLPSLMTDAGRAILERHLDGVSLVVIDNLSTLCPTPEENSATEWESMQSYLLDLRRRGYAVLLVHHDGQGGTQRGTSRHEDVLSQIIQLKRPKDYRLSEGARFEVHLTKGRGIYGPDAEPFEAHLTTGPDGREVWTWRNLEDAVTDRVLQLHRDGLSQRQIGKETGVPRSTVNRKLKKAREKGQI